MFWWFVWLVGFRLAAEVFVSSFLAGWWALYYEFDRISIGL